MRRGDAAARRNLAPWLLAAEEDVDRPADGALASSATRSPAHWQHMATPSRLIRLARQNADEKRRIGACHHGAGTHENSLGNSVGADLRGRALMGGPGGTGTIR